MDLNALTALVPYWDPLAAGIVGGGTALAVVLRTPRGELLRGLSAVRVVARRRFTADPLLAQLAALTRIARRHGLIALDRTRIEDRDLAAAVAAIVDGASPVQVEALLEQRRAERFERHRGAWELWSGAADTAPAMGMVGTLIGLVAMFGAMREPAQIGGAMAVALLATLYGALVASLVALPIANRLKRLARHEAQERLRLQAPLAALAAIEPAVPRSRIEIAA